MPQIITLKLTCHICKLNYLKIYNLKRHLKDVHGIVIEGARGKEIRRADTEDYIYSSPNTANALIHHRCIACDYHGASILDLKEHLTKTHTVSEINVEILADEVKPQPDLDEELIPEVEEELIPEVEEELIPEVDEELIPEVEENVNHVTSKTLNMLDKAYNNMQEDRKWQLSTGKCVENELYKFAKKCTYDHPSLSFIIDPYDITYIQHGVFTENEIQEIKEYNAVVMDTLPKDLVDYLLLFDCRTSEELRKACFENQKWYYPFNRTEHFYHDWIRRTVDMLIAEFESGSLKKEHHENWYMIRIWSLIDRMFSDVEDLEAVRGESTSIASSTRKNQDRVVPSMNGSAEYGCAEAGAKDEGMWGTKKLVEKGVKATKVLKDMLNDLCNLVDKEECHIRRLSTIGYIISGLSLELMIMDSPKGYCCRIKRTDLFSIPDSASQVRSKLLPLLSILIATKLHVVKVINTVEDHGLSDERLRRTLANVIESGQSFPGSPLRKPLLLPSCNITPTKRKHNNIS
ncbi:hypothetical protein INT44_007737 [Umbelopsis vinacea]|uniref:C2H2-type domain-containing protein n=1 Tax=Umbelopsis vinacea TaxID=44442 RepID=A0A8H7PKQ2_9FUNG|nr:hypothetical protein INT44_007737 [Umbelopsis vinacea]